MANELLDVVPTVQSMPTTGWFCQTTGSARRRITKNTSSAKLGNLDIEGTFDVAGVPGHTHNANAVVSIDANYSKYRTAALTVAAGAWGPAAIALPVGILTDSHEPDHAEERYERAIERCVGYTALFPENCTGHIREPTRSIGEIRTLVAPKARLDTLTYTEERGGWRIPGDQDDHKETSTHDVLVSDFPDVYIDVRPHTIIKGETAVVEDIGDDGRGTPSSLFLESASYRYRIIPEADFYTIGTYSDGTAWDGTLRLVWDYEQRLYKTLSEVSITLNNVQEVELEDGADTLADPYDAAVAAGNHNKRLTVIFPIVKTTKALDGFCWLANMNNEEALNYASRTSGLVLAPRIEVDVLGILENVGPFKWIGMPACRIPVGGSYAYPAADILQETHGDGTATDLQANFWDKFQAFTTSGLLRYQWRQQQAEFLADGFNPNTVDEAEQRALARLGFQCFSLTERQTDTRANSGFFQKRTGNSVLSKLTESHYDVQPHFNRTEATQYATAFAGGFLNGHLLTAGFRRSVQDKDDVLAALSANPNFANPSTVFSNSREVNASYILDNTIYFDFPNAGGTVGVAAALSNDARVSDKFCKLAMTPLFYQLEAGQSVGDFSGPDLFLSYTTGGGARAGVVEVFCECSDVSDVRLTINSNLQNFPLAEGFQGYRITGGTIAANTGYIADAPFYLRGWSMWLHPADGGAASTKSNFTIGAANLPGEGADLMRTYFRDTFATGNKFAIDAARWGTSAILLFVLHDYSFAFKNYKGPVFFETVAAVGNRKVMFAIEQESIYTSVLYTAQGANQEFVEGRLNSYSNAPYIWDQAAGTTRLATLAEMQAAAGDLNMYLPGADWWSTHVDSNPYAAIEADSQRLGAVFQSIKRISQHVCAPVLNPNLRIGATAPLNHDSRHLPPEMRDFRLQLQDIDWGRLQSERVTINDLTLYEFKDGIQKVGAEQNIMYLPQFREFKQTVHGGAFEISIFSELGSPSFFTFFCRSATTDILQQPLIKTLSIACGTTKKKSNTITDMSIGQLYHLTQRNVHAAAEYGRAAFNRRQTILLSAEDVGLLGLKAHEYQKAKRVEYTFSGTCDRPGNFYIVLVYNNRGLHIDGRRLQVVTLHE